MENLSNNDFKRANLIFMFYKKLLKNLKKLLEYNNI